jgi:P27 family predicted phage terminase small subunit
MGKGRKPTPTNILKLRGSWRAKTRPNEPTPEVTKVEAPEFLGAREREIFDKMAQKLFDLGVLTEIDAGALTRYATILVRWMDAARQMAEGVATHIAIKDDAGKVKSFMPTPPYMVFNKSNEQLMKLESEFGLTPAARPRLQSSNGGKDGIVDIMRAIQ